MHISKLKFSLIFGLTTANQLAPAGSGTMVLYIHKNVTDNLNLIEVANDFVVSK